jgi:DNA-binding Lrp family transcriptional regulator
LNALRRFLLNDLQRDFPLSPRPFAEIAESLGVDEATVLEEFALLQRSGEVSRIGAVINPGAVGASTLAALSIPQDRLEEVASMVNSYPEVNHNYEREHEINLWFVVTARDQQRLAQVLEEIQQRSGLELLNLPMEAGYFLDLGFDLQWS